MPRKLPPSVFALILANAFPLVAVLTRQWSVFAVVLLYWSENVVIGGFNVLRMLTAWPDEKIAWVGKAFIIPFFMFHYGMFCFVHGIFVMALFGGKTHGGGDMSLNALAAAVRTTGIGWALAALVASHAFSFFHNYIGGGEYRRVNPVMLMAAPYGRVVVLHIAIIGAGFLLLALDAPIAGLVLLVVLKTALDLRAHLAERAKLGGGTGTPGPVPPPPAVAA